MAKLEIKNINVSKTVFEYDNYREYLRDYYMSAKARDKKFSFRYFARIGGFKSGNILKIVIDGKINIVDETVEKFCKALKLNREESLFFTNLVHFNQAQSTEERLKYSRELLRSLTFRKMHPLMEAQYRYFDCWYYPTVRGLVNTEGFKEDLNWIAKQISPQITPGEVRKAIDELLQLQLLSRNETGKLVLSSPTVTTSNAITSCSLANYHREMMKKAAESIDRFPREQRDLSALTLTVSKENVGVLKEMAEKFRQDVLDVVSRGSALNAVYQLNIYLFPVAMTSEKEEPK